ncbi:hypothetical protein H8E88_03545 [candidate division KSB1 bacterium]|nr:hypothetical protein [candidate division KSB1 bacterium]MBL7105876.1 hypothetical protein [Bacteroidales bacterium]
METNNDIEKLFNSLASEEKTSILTHGMAFYMSAIKKRLFLAQSKVHGFEEKYHTTIEKLEINGLPDDAGFEMHEDYIMWHHWNDISNRLENRIKNYQGSEMIELSIAEALNGSD